MLGYSLRSRRYTRRGEEAPAAKALVFRYLRYLTVRRMPLTKYASWELVCHVNALFQISIN